MDDITYCDDRCNRKRCFRHKSNIKDLSIPHSFSHFKNTAYCEYSTENKSETLIALCEDLCTLVKNKKWGKAYSLANSVRHYIGVEQDKYSKTGCEVCEHLKHEVDGHERWCCKANRSIGLRKNQTYPRWCPLLNDEE